MRIHWMIGAAALPLFAVSCSDDEKDTVTHEEWFDAVCVKINAVAQPDFEAFFTEHPEPTLDDWAAFLPEVVESVDALIESIDSVAAAPEDQKGIDAAVAAMTVVRDNFAGSLAAAEAGDQATFDELDTKNQNTDVPAMEAAMDAVDDRDC